MNRNINGKVITLRCESRVLSNNTPGDPAVRDVLAYLPPGYEDGGSERFPVVYCLSGFAGRGQMMVNDDPFSPNLVQSLDRMIVNGNVRPMIAVMPDCFTYYGGSQYLNSTATGNYEDHLAFEITAFIDENLRTVAGSNGRAVMGKSSGGYGALIMGMRHADIFGLVCSISGDAYFEHCYQPDIPKAFRVIKGDPTAFMKRFWQAEKKKKEDFAGLNMIGMSACYSPNGSGFDLPFDLETGELRPDIWEKWLKNDPVRLVENSVENLKSLRLLFIDAGKRDEFALDLGARILSRNLKRHNVPHIHEEFDDGHFNISYRYARSLELISENF